MTTAPLHPRRAGPFVFQYVRSLLKELVSALAVCAFLGGCANTALTAGQARAREAAVLKLQKIEVFYSPQQELPVYDRGGTRLAGLSGLLLGPTGMVYVMSLHVASKLAASVRAAERGQAFTRAVAASQPGSDINRDFAESLASRIRASGREAKVTATARPTGELQAMKLPGAAPAPTDGYTPLLLRITTGYTAPDAISAFVPVVIVQQRLQHGGPQPDLSYASQYTADAAAPEFMRYDTLLADHAAAYRSLGTILNGATDTVYRNMFGADPKPVHLAVISRTPDPTPGATKTAVTAAVTATEADQH
ncbi:MAG: hypothetical protein EOO28_24220 [Comamonadaceae bacterium]|nr:MAG: hypothetical protein EOO28_24220 [Comamonadaceae bacterium]